VQLGRFKLAVRAAVVVAVLLVGLAALLILEQRRTQAELGAVLSDLIREEVLRDLPGLGSQRRIQIIFLREAQPPGLGPEQSGPWSARWHLLLERRLRFPQASLVTRSSFVLSNAVPTDIRPQLHLPNGVDSAVISRRELERMQYRELQQRFPNNLGYFAVSQPGFNLSKTEAVLYIDHFCPGLCGGGEYVLMHKVNGVWRVVDAHGTWVS
jgi:hypothetical protein